MLPLSVGVVLRDALTSWSHAPLIVVTVMLYAAWLVGLVALVALHPMSFTALRVVAPSAALLAILGVRSSSAAIAALAIVHGLAACVSCLHGTVAATCTQAASYGDEIRRPLRTPPLMCLVLAFVVPLIVGGIVTGPLLLADGRIPSGVALTVVGVPLAVLLCRSVHSLARRFVVFVPAGFVVSDPLTMFDPVLLPREKIQSIALAPPTPRVDGIDTRLGALVGAIVIELNEPGSFTLRRGRNVSDGITASSVWCTPQRPSSVLATAAERRLGAVTQRPR